MPRLFKEVKSNDFPNCCLNVCTLNILQSKLLFAYINYSSYENI